MTVSRRESILARMFAILQGLAGAETVARNRGLLDQEARPALVLLDGDETGRPISNIPRGRPGMKSPQIVVMNPQIFVLLKNKLPQNVDVGPLLNAWRSNILTAIATDASLIALIGPNGDIQYDGCETDLKSGSTMSGEMQISLSVRTILTPLST